MALLDPWSAIEWYFFVIRIIAGIFIPIACGLLSIPIVIMLLGWFYSYKPGSTSARTLSSERFEVWSSRDLSRLRDLLHLLHLILVLVTLPLLVVVLVSGLSSADETLTELQEFPRQPQLLRPEGHLAEFSSSSVFETLNHLEWIDMPLSQFLISEQPRIFRAEDHGALRSLGYRLERPPASSDELRLGTSELLISVVVSDGAEYLNFLLYLAEISKHSNFSALRKLSLVFETASSWSRNFFHLINLIVMAIDHHTTMILELGLRCFTFKVGVIRMRYLLFVAYFRYLSLIRSVKDHSIPYTPYRYRYEAMIDSLGFVGKQPLNSQYSKTKSSPSRFSSSSPGPTDSSLSETIPSISFDAIDSVELLPRHERQMQLGRVFLKAQSVKSNLPCHETSAQSQEEIPDATAGEDVCVANEEDYDPMARLAPLFQQQIKDALEPLLGPVASLLASRAESQRRQRASFLALEGKKLALRREKIQLQVHRRGRLQFQHLRRSSSAKPLRLRTRHGLRLKSSPH